MLKKFNKKIFLIVMGSLFAGILISVIGNQGVTATSQNSFCLTCHDATEFIKQFEERSHVNVGCVDCHSSGFVQDKLKGTSKFFQTVAGKLEPNDYTAFSTIVPDETCLSCHNLNSVGRDRNVILDHEDYIFDGETCTSGGCHNVEAFHGELGDFSKD